MSPCRSRFPAGLSWLARLQAEVTPPSCCHDYDAAASERRLPSTVQHSSAQHAMHFHQNGCRYPEVPLMALTATATPRVQHDVVQQLCLRKCVIFRSSFNRANLRCADLLLFSTLITQHYCWL